MRALCPTIPVTRGRATSRERKVCSMVCSLGPRRTLARVESTPAVPIADLPSAAMQYFLSVVCFTSEARDTPRHPPPAPRTAHRPILILLYT